VSAAEAFNESRERNVFVATTPAAQVLEALEHGLGHALPIVLLTGEAGVGKTATLHEAVARWASRVQPAWLDSSRTSASSIFSDTIRAFGGHVRGKDKRPEQVGRLTHALGAIRDRGLMPLLLVDSAQMLDSEALTELGRIESASSAAGFELKIILAGRPELVDRLASDQNEPIEVHVGVRTVHGKMSLADTREYLTHVLGGQTTEGDEVFPRKSAREIHEGGNGLPAMINALADEAIRCAHAAGSAQVGPEHVRAVIAAAFKQDAVEGAEDGSPADGAAAATADAGAPGTERAPEKKGKPGAPPIPEKPKRIAAHKPVAMPEGAAAHNPPPAARKRSLPMPPAPELDSSHPRVRDWVSRFTDGQPPIRFGGRGTLPVGESGEGQEPTPSGSMPLPDALRAEKPEGGKPARAGSPPEAPRDTAAARAEPPRNRRLERARDAEAAKKPQGTVMPRPSGAHPLPDLAQAKTRAAAPGEPPRETAAHGAGESHEAPPAPRAHRTHPLPDAPPPRTPAHAAPPPKAPPPPELTHFAKADPAPLEVPEPARAAPVPLEVTPEQLTPPPLVLDVSPAPVPPVRETARAPVAPEPPRIVTPPPAPPRIETRPAASMAESRPTPSAESATVAAAAPSAPAMEPRGADAGPPPNGQPGSLSRKQQKSAARRAERAARRAAEAQARQASQPPAPAPRHEARPTAAPASAAAQASARPQASATEPKSAPAAPVVLTPEAVKPVSVTSPASAKASTSGAVPSRTLSHLRPTKPDDVVLADVTPPRLDRVLAVLIPAILILGMAIAAFILGRRGAFDRQVDAGADRVDPVTTIAPPAEVAPVADSVSAPDRAADSAAAEAQPFEPPVEEPFAEPEADPTPGPARYCLAVGTYLFEERAKEKARTLRGRTGQDAWVVPVRAGGSRSYRILFGAFPSEGAAERAADRLLTRGYVTEAMVENLPAPQRRR
jgi:type II secretory pathway predicted ATPase ExeA